MRIIKVITSLGYGGAESQVMGMARELDNLGHEIYIIALSDDKRRLGEIEGGGVKYIGLNKKYKLDVKLMLRLRNEIKKIKPDVVHAYLFDAEFYSRLACLGLNAVILNSVRTDDYVLNKHQFIGHVLTRFMVDGVVANSYSGAEYSKKYYTLPSKKLSVVWNGIDCKVFNNRLSASKKAEELIIPLKAKGFKIAVMVAAVKPDKNYELALELANRLAQDNWYVLFVGDKLNGDLGGYKEKILFDYSQLENKEEIEFLGNRNDIPALLSLCDVSFLTSHREGFPNVVIESMLAGTPVVTTRFSDISMISLNEWQVCDSIATELHEAIDRCYTERNLLSRQSAEWVEKNLSIYSSVNELLKVYSGYISERS